MMYKLHHLSLNSLRRMCLMMACKHLSCLSFLGLACMFLFRIHHLNICRCNCYNMIFRQHCCTFDYWYCTCFCLLPMGLIMGCLLACQMKMIQGYCLRNYHLHHNLYTNQSRLLCLFQICCLHSSLLALEF